MMKRDSHVSPWRMTISDSKHTGPQMRTDQPGLCRGRSKARVTGEHKGREIRWEGRTVEQVKCSSGVGKE